MSTRNRVNAIAFSKLMRCLHDGPHTLRELVQETGLTRGTVSLYVHALRREKLVRIAGWDTDSIGRTCLPAFAIGSEPDARRVKMSRKESNARYRASVAMKTLCRALAEPIKEAA